jgi:hypothetical protein
MSVRACATNHQRRRDTGYVCRAYEAGVGSYEPLAEVLDCLIATHRDTFAPDIEASPANRVATQNFLVGYQGVLLVSLYVCLYWTL